MIRCRLSTYMGREKLTMVEVAKKIGVHRNTISLLYKEDAKKVDLETLEKLCDLFDCSVGDMLYLEKESAIKESRD